VRGANPSIDATPGPAQTLFLRVLWTGAPELRGPFVDRRADQLAERSASRRSTGRRESREVAFLTGRSATAPSAPLLRVLWTGVPVAPPHARVHRDSVGVAVRSQVNSAGRSSPRIPYDASPRATSETSMPSPTSLIASAPLTTAPSKRRSEPRPPSRSSDEQARTDSSSKARVSEKAPPPSRRHASQFVGAQPESHVSVRSVIRAIHPSG